MQPTPDRPTWIAAVVATALLLGLIAAAAGSLGWELSAVVLVAVAGVVVMLNRVFPGSRFFAITFANGIGVYACVYISFLETLFHGLHGNIMVTGFLLPVLGFAAGAFLRRDGIRKVILSEHPRIETRFGRAFLWLAPVIAIGVVNFLLPLEAWDESWRAIWLLVAMGLIAVIVLLASHSVAIFLLDTGLLFEDFFDTVTQLVKPAFAFLTFYSMIVVVFGGVYRLIGRLDSVPTFVVGGQARDLSFVESLYFSIVTLSTVGYGDIVPLSYAIRIVVALQIVSGIVLLLFGFHAILRQARRN